jgi:hypothetical protein
MPTSGLKKSDTSRDEEVRIANPTPARMPSDNPAMMRPSVVATVCQKSGEDQPGQPENNLDGRSKQDIFPDRQIDSLPDQEPDRNIPTARSIGRV